MAPMGLKRRETKGRKSKRKERISGRAVGIQNTYSIRGSLKNPPARLIALACWLIKPQQMIIESRARVSRIN